MAITAQQLLQADYRRYDDRTQMSSGAFQKRIDDEEGRTRYFITFRLWDMSIIPNYPAKLDPLRMEPEVQFYKNDGEAWFNVIGFVNQFETLDQLERFYHTMWSTMNCGYYE